jgi:predicted PilT family ATPase
MGERGIPVQFTSNVNVKKEDRGMFVFDGNLMEQYEKKRAKEMEESEKTEPQRISVLNKDGSIKSREEIYKIGVERQWKLVLEWLDKRLGNKVLAWSGPPLFEEVVERLGTVGIKQHSFSNGIYIFKLVIDGEKNSS